VLALAPAPSLAPSLASFPLPLPRRPASPRRLRPHSRLLTASRGGLTRGSPCPQAQGQQECNISCTFIIDHKPAGTRARGHAAIFLGDLEVYRRDPGGRKLGPRGGGASAAGNGAGEEWEGQEDRVVVFREAESKFPAAAWEKYQVKVTYSRAAHVSYGYLDDLDNMLAEAVAAVRRPELRPELLGAVLLRCGVKGGGSEASSDRRRQRARFVEELSRLLPVKSYGECAKNAEWPAGLERDKLGAMRRARFCLAFENSDDADYVTEKLFDCLRAGAIPIVGGGEHIRLFAPPGSSIFIHDHPSTAALAAFITEVLP